ncbi:sulfite exporter TauE/SafE family protein [Paenalkalicoccus suaedae]|uniref:Sulfite exporter TauE/SafE family protein n=1 Tax=Paenalkalicoccus suaedae TaxID=2592382 RepID=A0A859FJ90_9BACI|nr:sulfite exporter TauE/SafE family protein [Paenalkalicoccus suaedae]QKS72676.1 sulfite exporter TauE/SafE family protein [Paenalkalicoccus suaedae]
MFDYVERISAILREPFMNAALAFESTPIVFAFVLGIVGALAPCQFSGNLSAITLYGSRSLREGISWPETFFYTLGKIVAFTGLGALVWLIGQEFQRELTPYFPWLRRIVGPTLIIMGLYMIGAFRLTQTVSLWRQRTERIKGKGGAFMLGFSFSLAFCPTMFILFFGLLMPLTFTSSVGGALPAVFAVGTALPFLFIIGSIWFLGAGSALVKKGRRVGRYVQYVAGAVLIVIGVLDIVTFW